MKLIDLFNEKATDGFRNYVHQINPSNLELINAYNNYILSLQRDLMYNPSEKIRVRVCEEMNYLVLNFEYEIQHYLRSIKKTK